MAARDVPIAAARAWAMQLVAFGGIFPRPAAVIAARRYGVDVDELFVTADPAVARTWRTGSRLRPTTSLEEETRG
jgi:hypothetical protein